MRKSVPISRRRSECCSYLQKYTTCFDSRADEVYHCPVLLAARSPLSLGACFLAVKTIVWSYNYAYPASLCGVRAGVTRRVSGRVSREKKMYDLSTQR